MTVNEMFGRNDTLVPIDVIDALMDKFPEGVPVSKLLDLADEFDPLRKRTEEVNEAIKSASERVSQAANDLASKVEQEIHKTHDEKDELKADDPFEEFRNCVTDAVKGFVDFMDEITSAVEEEEESEEDYELDEEDEGNEESEKDDSYDKEDDDDWYDEEDDDDDLDRDDEVLNGMKEAVEVAREVGAGLLHGIQNAVGKAGDFLTSDKTTKAVKNGFDWLAGRTKSGK